jgi:hypothetical protein
VPEAGDCKRPHSILQHWRPRLRFARLQATLESFRSSGVSEIEVLENFGRAPLALVMTPEVFGAHVSGSGRDRFL